MKSSQKTNSMQLRLIEKKLKPWLKFRAEIAPPSGWIKAIRGSIGMSVSQLAQRLDVNPAAVTQLEQREPTGKVTLDSLEKAAQAMHCKVIYAVVPQNQFSSLDSIIEERVKKLATEMISRVDISMQLEEQGLKSAELKEQLKDLETKIKSEMISQLWQDRLRKKVKKADKA